MVESGFSWRLADHPRLPKGRTVAVVVLDGWGEARPDRFDCVHVAETPTMDALKKMIIIAIEQVGGIYIITADHGNAEDMVKRDKNGKLLIDKEGNIQILTSHTLNPVPIAIGGPGLQPGARFRMDVSDAGLANVAATVMNIHGFEAPSDYEPTLIEAIDG